MYCEYHLAAKRKSMRKLREKRAAKGRCYNCNHPSDGTRCKAHSDVRNAKRREDTARYVRDGMCVYCHGKNPATDGVLCARHKALSKQYAMNSKMRRSAGVT